MEDEEEEKEIFLWRGGIEIRLFKWHICEFVMFDNHIDALHTV